MAPAQDAVDYRKLYFDEKRKARHRNQESIAGNNSLPSSQQEEPPIPRELPEWNGGSSALKVPELNRLRDCVSNQDPGSIFYKESFLPSHFCNDLWQWLEKLPVAATAKSQKHGHWHNLHHSKRKVAVFDGSFPRPIQLIAQALIEAGIFDESVPPNHILINHYTPSQGIMPHTDGPAYFSRTTTLSLGNGQVLLHFEPRQKGAFSQRQLLLHGGGSLVVFEGDAYSHCMHSIRETDEEYETAESTCCNVPAGTKAYRQERISLTVRHRFDSGLMN
ncbi:alkylated DNA repair protein alkB homolog 6 [Fistulifera solaris]|jgi:alkylated DNA repair protein alkB family protein 6|uniref:Alkylated DNA repair protein alkB homolog 6 n=1 Tax=Fistulifera solaris TaxID=1519565 RepID=A0A1Z5JEW6_FISSO|nr:alkylated DNA repair protein alkB homolog 6 [Fistulifera solaris]|eukprot:GAX12301.1 alkylated DNA repair protein alkB homolog 6 [Fistulifera solaris]